MIFRILFFKNVYIYSFQQSSPKLTYCYCVSMPWQCCWITADCHSLSHTVFHWPLPLEYKTSPLSFCLKGVIKEFISILFLLPFLPTFPFNRHIPCAVLYMYVSLLGKIAADLGGAAESAAGQRRVYFRKKICMQKSLFMHVYAHTCTCWYWVSL